MRLDGNKRESSLFETTAASFGGIGVASVFDIPAKAPIHAAAKLRLLSHKLMPGGVIWVRYRVVEKNTR